MKLKFGMVGGGNGAFIGDVHRHGAQFDDLAILVAGCFTRNMDRNLETAEKWNVTDPTRVYANYREMAEKEAQREDGIDFVTIATPNDSHYEIAKTFMEHGIHIMCDKPLALNVQQGMELEAIAKEKDLLFGVTYTYTGYAMIRQAREMIDHGEIGKIISVMGEYPQEWLAVSLASSHSEQATWRMDPARSGESGCAADIGTHVECLISKMTGLELEAVLARFDSFPPHLPLETNVQAMLRYKGNIPGMMWTSQVAMGHETDVCVRIFGEKGAIEWNHYNPSILKVTRINQPVQYYSAARDFLYDSARDLCRLPSGHIEGFYEAFGNLYRGFCKNLIAKKTGESAGSYSYPTVHDGLCGIKFVEACIKSNARGNIWVNV
ncbi:MAG TPA: Gfo/Idh/MocA family oxidoreductase [Clostridia bacterium]|nr:Gfo/Idh/MocA family oxidoreductase [Clostridia bacterium]